MTDVLLSEPLLLEGAPLKAPFSLLPALLLALLVHLLLLAWPVSRLPVFHGGKGGARPVLSVVVQGVKLATGTTVLPSASTTNTVLPAPAAARVSDRSPAVPATTAITDAPVVAVAQPLVESSPVVMPASLQMGSGWGGWGRGHRRAWQPPPATSASSIDPARLQFEQQRAEYLAALSSVLVGQLGGAPRMRVEAPVCVLAPPDEGCGRVLDRRLLPVPTGAAVTLRWQLLFYADQGWALRVL